MARITFTTLTRGVVNAGSNPSATTASITPKPNRLILVAVISTRSFGGSVNIPTLSGNGITWVQITTVVANSNNWRLTLFRGMSTAPTTGAITIDFAGQSQDQGLGWFVEEVANVLASGASGADAIVQSNAAVASGPNNTGLNISLSPFQSLRNATYGVVATQGGSITPAADFTELGEQGFTATGCQDQYSPGNKTVVGWTWGATGTEGPGIAVEIRASSPSGLFMGGSI